MSVRLTLCYVTAACLMQMAAAAELLRGLAGWIGEILAENPKEVLQDIQQAAAQLHDEALLVGRLHNSIAYQLLLDWSIWNWQLLG